MTDSLFVETRGGFHVCVPRSIASMTTYALLEQEDWFEDEIRFVRRLLGPGMNAIDIGANYGVYTLSMAKAVGPGGRIWSFEPASATAGFLRRSLARNAFANVDLQQCALSNTAGRRRLRLESASELNRLSDDGGPGEDVAADTLDGFAARAVGAPVEFIKIDAEGEERNIIEGGAQTLGAHSPLVMIERMHGKDVNAPAIAALRDLGFGLYRLVPGLNILVPFDEGSVDGFQLNLFACRRDRAARLERLDLLTAALPPVAARNGAGAQAIAGMPFFRAFAAAAAPPGDAAAAAFRAALDLYMLARDARQPAPVRWSALRNGLGKLLGLAGGGFSTVRLFTLARVAAEAGERSIAVQALGKLPLEPAAYDGTVVTEPFLPASPRFETIEPQREFGLWCAVAVFEQMERLRALSSQYAGDDALPYFESFRATRFFSPELERRRQLVRMRTGRQQGPEPAPLLAARSDSHLNAAFWAGRA